MSLTPPVSSPRQRAAPSTSAQRESPTPSQLDILAERNERFAKPSLFARAAIVLAILGVVLVLVAVLWWVAQRAGPAVPGAAPKAVAPAAVDPLPRVAPTITSDGPAAETLPASAAALTAAPSAVPAQAQASGSAPSTAGRAGKPQARTEGDARAKALPAPAQRERQQRGSDPPRDLTADTAAAAETLGGAGPAASGAETASRPSAEAVAAGVREFCAARGNIVSELLCRTRECRKPERAKDATCVRLKEIEDAQRRVDSQ